MNKSLKKILIYILLTDILYGCASQATPTGGKKDILAPKIENSIPINESVNYQGKNIEVIFSEMVSVESIKQELLITPRPEGNYEYEIKKNRLTLKFEKPFKANTTYTFNFRKSIKDITEKNIAENAKLVFSTGNTIDSLYISGNVKEILTNKPVEDALIMLYQVNDTLTVTKHSPYYLTKTDSAGNYLLENLREDDYNIYALSEKNNNQKYDRETEKIGFLNALINLQKNLDTINFNIATIDTTQPKLIRARPEKEYFQMEFNEGLISTDVKGIENPQAMFYQLENNNKIKVYNTLNRYDSIPVQIMVEDSLGNKFQKEIKIKFNEIGKDKENKKEKLVIDTNPKDKEKVQADFLFKIGFNKPILKYDLAQVSLLADTITPIELKTGQEIKWNNTYTELTIAKKIKIQNNIRVSIPEGTFYTVEGDTSSKIITTHELKDPSEYGTIQGKVVTNEKNIIVQLIDTEYKVIAEQKNAFNYTFNYLNAGKYLIRIVVDNNENGKWDTGNFNKLIQPEKIFYSDKVESLKENWDLTINEIIF